jgi:hypothetical protein
MSLPYDSSLDPDRLQTALDASCYALMMLQSLDLAPGASEVCAAHRHLRRATESLRCAIEELRLAHGEEPSMVGLGFVVRTDSGRRRAG